MSTAEDRAFESLQVGETCVREHTLTAAMAADFASLSGDYNPLHTDATYVASTQFGKLVVHGMLLGALVSELVGMHLPGKKCLIVKESLEFKLPAFVGDTVEVQGTIVHKSEAARLLEVGITICRGEEVLAKGTVYTKVL